MRISRRPAMVESMEGRTLFALDVTAAAFSPGQPQLVFTDIISSDTGGSSATAAQVVTVRNTGPGIAQIFGLGIGGSNASEFEQDNWPSVPFNLQAGASLTLPVRFRAASVGLKTAFVQVQTTSPGQTDIQVALRGIGTTSDNNGDVSGNNEPSLQRILNAFQIPVNVGDSNGENTFDLPTPRPPGTVHEEVEMQRLRKAGSGPVVIEPLAEYAFNTQTGPIGHFGYYTPGTKDAKTELYAVSVNERTSVNPTWSGSFDPGSAEFALYGDFNGTLFEINSLPRGVYSEDSFNTWDANNKKKVRFFPLKNSNGSVVPNAFVFAFEEFNAGYDSNDVVGIIRNVTAGSNGPEIGTESLDRGLPGPARLVFNRIQVQPPVRRVDGVDTILPNNVVHDKAKVRVHNSGSSTLNITSVVLSNTSDFQINTTGLNGSTIAPGASKDIEVQFIATSGDIETGTLTINTNDADEPATVIQLAGKWQNKSENNEEPNLPNTVNNLLGYGTVIVGAGQQLNPTGQSGKVQAVGDEILSPYWRRADAARAVEVVQLSAYHSHDSEATFRWFLRGTDSATNLFTHQKEDAQSFFPHLKGSSTSIAATTFKPTQGSNSNPAFGFRVDNERSDPTLNVQEQSGGGFGHHVRFWPLKDSAGNVVPNTFILGMDYLGINYDYQDNIYIIRNITPADPPTGGGIGAPAGLSATGSESGIALDWSNNSEATLAGYNVYRGTTSDFTPSASNKLNASLLTSSQFNDANAPVGATSFYKVTAVDTQGTESTATSASATRPDVVTPELPPPTPTGLSASAASTSSISVLWNPTTGATSYTLERRPQGGGSFTILSSTLTATSFVDTGLQSSTTYEYRVSAANAEGTSLPSTTASATTLSVSLPPPPAATVENASVDEPTSGTANMTFTISLSTPATSTIVLNVSTADGSATAGSDYTASSGTVTFAQGESSKTFVVPILADQDNVEPTQSFVLNLAVNAGVVTLADPQATGAIISSSAPPPPETLTFGGRAVARFTGSNGKPARISIKGPGSGEVELLDSGAVNITVTGSTLGSSLSISGSALLAGVNVDGALKSFAGKTSDLAGGLAVSGGVGKLTLRNATGGHAINIGAGSILSVTLASASDLSVVSNSPIKSFKAAQWLNTDSVSESLTAPSLASLTVKGDLTADIFVGDLGKLNVSGVINGASVRSGGNIGSVRAAAMRDSLLFAGVRDDLNAMPDSADDFSQAARITSVSIRGRSAPSFSNSTISASSVGKLSLGQIATDNAGNAFGISAGDLASASGTTPGSGRFSVKNLAEPSESTQEADFLVRLL